MSLAHAGIGAGGGVMGGMQAYSMPAPMSTHTAAGTGGSACNDGCCGPSGPDLSMMAANSKTGRFRGELSGNQCLSIELGEDKIAGAVWSESDFSSNLLSEAISTAVGISQEGQAGVLGFFENPSAKTFDALKGLTFGPIAEDLAANKSTDVLFPSRYIGQEKDSSATSILSVLRSPGSTFSKTQALQLELPNSSSRTAETVNLHPEELVALQLQYWASTARANQQEADNTTAKGPQNKKKQKQKQKHERGVTLVVPGYFGQRQRNVVKTAARVAGLDLQQIYSRGLCATAAALFGPEASQTLNLLQTWTKKQKSNKNPVVMFVHVNTHGVEVSLIECEQPFERNRPTAEGNASALVTASDTGAGANGGGAGGMNAMYYDRLICVSSGGVGAELKGVSGGPVMNHKTSHSHNHVHGDGKCCDGHGKAKGGGGGGDMTSCYSQSVAKLVSSVISQQLKLADLTASDISLVLHSGQGSPLSLHETFALSSDLSSLQGSPLLPVPEDAPARGGAILTAAELDSSKQYIDLDEESILVHCLSIAEDVMSTSVGMLYIESQEMEDSFGKDNNIEDSIQCIYPAGTIIRKADVGPVRKQVTTPAVESKEFSDGAVNFFGSHCPTYKSSAFPKQLLVQYEPTLSSAGSEAYKEGDYHWHWRPVTDVGFPLLSDNGKNLLKTLRKAAKEGKDISTQTKGGSDKSTQLKQALLTCKINFKLNESQGLLTLEHAQGTKVVEKVKAKCQVAKIAYTFGFLVLMVFLYYAYGVYSDQEEHRQDTAWLTEFYEKHAPHKLEDGNLVEDTLVRYKGKLFVLWRKLEKTYEVKFSPPQRIVDSNYEF